MVNTIYAYMQTPYRLT